MGNRVIRIVLGIIIGLAALVGIYLVLPGNMKNPLIEFFQKTFQKGAYAVSEYYMQQQVPKQDITFGDMIANCGDGSAWVTDVLQEAEDGSTGQYEVHAYAYKVDVAMDQENGQENLKNYTQVPVEVRFQVKKVSENGESKYVTTSYAVYIEEEFMNDFYKPQCLASMAGKAKAKVANEAAREERDKATATEK